MVIKWELDIVNIATVLIALGALWLAWQRLSVMFLQTRANALLGLDERWESPTILSIRADLRNLIDEVEQKIRNQWPGASESDRRAKASEAYAHELQMMRTQNKDRYQQLFQICGFLETVGYVARAKYIPVKDIIDLFGGIIGVAGRVFTAHLHKLRGEEGAHSKDFEHFIWLVKERSKLDQPQAG